MSKLTTADIDEICRLYKEGISSPALGKQFGCTPTNIRHKLRARNIPRRRFKKITPQQALEIVERYGLGESSEALAVKYGVASQNILSLLHRRNIPIRNVSDSHLRYTVNHAAFDTVTEESAYWIGLLMADGCVFDRKNRLPVLTLSLAEKDKDHIARLRQFLSATHPLRSNPGKLNGKIFPRWRIDIASRGLCAALAKYGVVPRKSLIAQVAGLEMNRHFWRGIIDGDGSVYIAADRIGTKSSARISLVGAPSLLQQFISFVKERLPGVELRTYAKANNKAVQVHTSGTRALRILNLLYGDCTTALPRKADLAYFLLNRYHHHVQSEFRKTSFQKI